MNLTTTQTDNIMGHIEAAILLTPYCGLIKNIVDDIDRYRPFITFSYDEMLAINPDAALSEENYALIQQLIKLFDADLFMANGYLSMIEVIKEKYSSTNLDHLRENIHLKYRI